MTIKRLKFLIKDWLAAIVMLIGTFGFIGIICAVVLAPTILILTIAYLLWTRM